MSNTDTPVIVAWPIAWPPGAALSLQGQTPVPATSQVSGDQADPPGSLPIPRALGLGPIFPASGIR